MTQDPLRIVQAVTVLCAGFACLVVSLRALRQRDETEAMYQIAIKDALEWERKWRRSEGEKQVLHRRLDAVPASDMFHGITTTSTGGSVAFLNPADEEPRCDS